MQSTIGLRELREHMETYTRRVQRGASFIVMKHAKPLFKIMPVEPDEEWETVIDFTKFKKNGMPLDDLIARLKRMR